MREFVRACQAVTGRDIAVVERGARPGDAAAVFADVSTIEREIGWRARFTDLEAGLATAWQWARQHPNGYEDDEPQQHYEKETGVWVERNGVAEH